MIERILEIYNQSDFDFREFSNPQDELSYLFKEWVPYYKLKYSIARILAPKSILEIGVRYGYSARTFLEAVPTAEFVGVDNDSDNFGGSQGAISWAEKITNKFDVKFICADSQEMTHFPGDGYDLIHIDAQQDGDGTFNDLEKAIKKGKYILIDGFFWSKENMLSATYFSEKFKDFIEYIIIIPGYAGEYLIKVKENKKVIACSNNSYVDLSECYDEKYFLSDCGGFEFFKQGRGSKKFDVRLTSLLALTDIVKGEKVLDIGCGRGDLSYLASIAGGDVTGIDYSSASIQIANSTYSNDCRQLHFICSDFLQCSFNSKFNKIIAADFVEHVEQSKLEEMIKKISLLLEIDGYFIVHTAPNKNHYCEYEEKRLIAKSIGIYIPVNPRSYYEDLMHINEQTPEGLKKTLMNYFKYVYVWTTDFPDILGDLENASVSSDVKIHRSIIAIASHREILNLKLIQLAKQDRISIDNRSISITLVSIPEEISFKNKFDVEVSLNNSSDEKLTSLSPFPVFFSYHWKNDRGNFLVWDGIRTALNIPSINNSFSQYVEVIAPDVCGDYTLEITLVQEECFWFEEKDFLDPLVIKINVK